MEKIKSYFINHIMKKLTFRKIILLCCALCLVISGIFYFYTRVFGEQSGSSPDSLTTSRLKTVSNAVTSLSYGATTAGTWGDWGSMWNRTYSAAQGQFNDAKAKGNMEAGSGTGGLSGFTQALGGVDDYNNNGGMPSDTYTSGTWTACNAGNSYCNTSRSVAEKQDPNTGLVWSAQISASATWFVANNCVPGTCTSNGQAGCVCTKQTGGSKTGCEAYDDGLWRLPSQKELEQSYIDGSNSNLTNPNFNYVSSTTESTGTQYAWYIKQSTGNADNYTNATKTLTFAARCVR